ncbi:N/A [soil metagenome]
MKQYWQSMSLKIDALSLRERAIIFAAAALFVTMLTNMLVLDPLFVKQKKLSLQFAEDQTKIAQIRSEIDQKLKLQAFDPDAANRVRLKQLKAQSEQLQNALQHMQSGLVSPDKMASLLEGILKRDGKLRLLALKTLPVSSLTETSATDNKSADKQPPAAVAQAKVEEQAPEGAVYRHGVEITVQGSYPDMMNYVATLEAMPWQLFWGKARLNVDEYPKATLTLTLFTLSLDKKWLNI